MVFPVRWAARLTLYGHDTLTYGQSRPRAEPPPGGEEADRKAMELISSQMAALRVAEQVRAASCDHGIKRWRLHLAQKQMESVAYGLWLHRMTGSAVEANRFAREYGVVHSPARDSGEGPPAVRGGAGVGGRG
ncbi:DUF6417 family protein [Streptomyces sp. AK02-04a]|uniref:DUF6417 family protein n=1 Tax=Streptomyces sp. AK02-04a TaxID=3028649 RepID=UPI0029BB9B31|nr:DUF6417 family protein [Streptomyces sp. AK02-04a]MDX3762564.1 DUF6417 family protein [Streptomyces sp. AK02-04a]